MTVSIDLLEAELTLKRTNRNQRIGWKRWLVLARPFLNFLSRKKGSLQNAEFMTEIVDARITAQR